MGTARGQYTDEFEQDAVGLLASSGRPLSQIAEELGIALKFRLIAAQREMFPVRAHHFTG